MSPLLTYKFTGYRSAATGSMIAHVATDTGVSVTVSTPVRRHTVAWSLAGLGAFIIAIAAIYSLLTSLGLSEHILVRVLAGALTIWFGMWLMRRWRVKREQVTRLDLDAESLRLTVIERRRISTETAPRAGLVSVEPEHGGSFPRSLAREEDDPATAVRCRYADESTRILPVWLQSDAAQAACKSINAALAPPPSPPPPQPLPCAPLG